MAARSTGLTGQNCNKSNKSRFFVVMKGKFLILLVFIAALSSCVKEPSYPIEPVIEFKSVSNDYVYAGQADTITITFTDGDGDIGVTPNGNDNCNLCGLREGDSTCLRMSGFNVFIIDSRDTCVGTYASANIESSGKYKALSGEISIITAVDSKKCFAVPDPSCPVETFHYYVVIRDKAGNLSNIIRTSDITVDPR